MSARDSFVARFGEENAAAVESAARGHWDGDVGGVHHDDDFGSEPFRYWFLLAIGFECVTRFREDHGIQAAVEDMQDWAKFDGNLAAHDGAIPDYLAMMIGAYNDWISPEDYSETARSDVPS